MVKNPYPLDVYLNEGEVPFTDFGHLGVDHIDPRVFDQDTYWVDRFGTGHLLTEMTKEYLIAVHNHLTAFASQYLLSHYYYYEDTIHFTHTFPGKDPHQFAILSLGYDENYCNPAAASDWVAGTPLYKKISTLL